MEVNNFIILGAGVTGLTLGYELSKKGNNVSIFEISENVGGLARTIKNNDIPIDSGPHLFHSAHKEIIDYWKDLVGDNLVKKDFFAGNFKDGNIYDYPINRQTIKKQYTKDEIKIIESELSNIDQDKLSKTKNYSEYVSVLAGPFLAEKFFTKYPKKLWGLKTNELSARFAPRRIEIRNDKRPFHSGPGRFAGVIEGGCGFLAESLKEKFFQNNGKLNLNHKVIKFNFTKEKKIESIDFSNSVRLCTHDSIIISTLPINKNADLFNLKTKLYFRSVFLINIIIEGPDPFPKDYDWLYFDDDKVPFHRVGVQTRFSRKNVKDNINILCCEIAYNEKPNKQKIEAWKRDTINYLSKHDLINLNHKYNLNCMDLGPVYPGYYSGHEAELSLMNAKLGEYENFYSLGSLAEYAYSDLQVLTAKAIDLAKELDKVNKNYKNETLKNAQMIKPSSEFYFGNQLISSSTSNPVFLIAEIGLAHNGNVDICKELILEASRCGFNAVKIQTYKPGRISKKTRSARYFEETLDQEESISDYLDRIIFSSKELKSIIEYSNNLNIEFFSTPFDEFSVRQLEEMKVNGFKISSMDITNLPLIRLVSKTRKPVIISTGMANLGEIETAINICLENDNPNIALLHCVSSYPCDIEFSNLGRIKQINNSFGVITGFSDHTQEYYTPSLAVALGARIIEKHITLDKGMDGPDHNFSLEPHEMKKMVVLIRKSEKAISNHQIEKSTAELISRQNLRRSIYASSDLKTGDIATAETLIIKSPGDGIPAKFYDLILNKRIIKDIFADNPFDWSHFFNE